MKVTVKNLPMHLVFGEYNGQECEVREEFHSRQYGTSLRVRAMDGREFTVGPAQYIAPKADAARFAALAKSERKQFMAPDCAESMARCAIAVSRWVQREPAVPTVVSN